MSKRVAPVKPVHSIYRRLRLSLQHTDRTKESKMSSNCHFWPPAKYCRQVSARIEDGGVKPCLPTLKQWA
jgi:hypothetical protein